MRLVETAIRKPVSVAVGVLLVALFGLIGFYGVPIQLTPTVDRPRITVETTWRGASPYEVESEIVEEQEDVLKSVDRLIRMTSESKDGRGTVILESVQTSMRPCSKFLTSSIKCRSILPTLIVQ